jgi:hypothetical protein
MATKKEEQDEQNFFSEKVKEQAEHERKEHKMAAKTESESVAGYSGSPSEGKKIERPKDASKEAVVSDAGVTEPTIELGGDGVTPKAEWVEKYADTKKKQDEFDEKRRQRAVEDTGIVQTTEKHGVEKGKHNG